MRWAGLEWDLGPGSKNDE